VCHEPARKEKNGRRRNADESIGCDRDILWKTFTLSSERLYCAPVADKKPEKYGVVPLFTVKPLGGMAGLQR
jgi:hypothetical protein